jgi:hypothetical protein
MKAKVAIDRFPALTFGNSVIEAVIEVIRIKAIMIAIVLLFSFCICVFSSLLFILHQTRSINA